MKKYNNFWSVIVVIIGLVLFAGCSEKKAVNEEPRQPSIFVSVDSISVSAPHGGPSPYAQFVKITSDSGAGIEFAFSEASNWMVLSNAAGEPTGITPDSFLVTFRVVFPFMLDFGHYVDTIFISGNNLANSPQHVVVHMDIGSNLIVMPEMFDYVVALNGDNPEDKIMTVASNTDQPVNYTIEENSSWISLDKTTGQTADEDSLTVSVDIAGLAEGMYIDTIKVLSDEVYNSPQYVVCSLLVSPWRMQSSPLISAILLDTYFEDLNNGWIVGFVGDVQSRSGIILKTVDAGLTWDINLFADTLALFGIDSTLLGAIQFVNDTGWVVGEGGVILNSFDDGQSWNIVDNGLDIDLNNLYFLTGDIGLVVGADGMILRTTDAGVNWTVIPSPVTIELSSIYFMDNLNGWACGGNSIIITTDGGLSWTKQIVPSNPDIGLSYDFNSIHFGDINNGWAVGKLGYTVYTTDGGQNWTALKLGTDAKLSSVFFTNPLNGYIAGEDGSLLRTSNGGADWVVQITSSSSWLNSVFFIDDDIGWVVGGDGLILYTRSGGN